MRYWEGPPARAATGGLPFRGHRTMKEVQDAENLRVRVVTNIAERRERLRKRLDPEGNDNGTRTPDL
jgi:hypothetical protein